MRRCLGLVFMLALLCCTHRTNQKEDYQLIDVYKTAEPLIIDGKENENSWHNAQWFVLDQNWMGKAYDYEDFNGRYKLLWDEDALYIFLEINDDVLYDKHKDPLKLWWNDDSVQLFLDEDNSGGLHQYNHNAFGYNIALDGNVVDLTADKSASLFNHHIRSKKITDENLTQWEFAVKLYNKDYKAGQKKGNVSLKKGKKIGFALAYCDNDGSTERENYIGSVFVAGEDKNQAWINADIFGTLVLKE